MELELTRGEQFPIEFKINNDDGTPTKREDLQEIIFVCRQFPEETSPILFKKTLSENDITGDDGVYQFLLKVEDTKDLEYGIYGCEVKVVTIANFIRKEVGSLTITKEYSMGY